MKLFGGEKPEKEFENPLSKLSEEQKKTLNELKTKIEALEEFKDPAIKNYLTDLTYFRFCSGWKWKIDKAFEYLSETIKWRKVYRPEKIKITDLNFLKDISEPICYHCGYDKEGHPIVYIHLANTDKIKDDKDGDKKFQLICYVMESVYKLAMPKGHYQCVLVVDADKIGLLWAGTIKRFGGVFGKLGDRYCEMLYKAYAVNVGWTLRAIWTLAKGFMHPTTVKKFSVGKNCEKMKETIDENLIPKEFNGKSEYCYDFLKHVKFNEENKIEDFGEEEKKEEKVEVKEDKGEVKEEEEK